MACTSTKFIINRGLTNEFIITIKQDDSTLPMVIDPADTFELKLYLLEDNSEVATITQILDTNGQITTHDAPNGQIKVTMLDSLVDTLLDTRGDRADYYYAKPLYRLAIDASTLNNGNFVAKVDKVYVK